MPLRHERNIVRRESLPVRSNAHLTRVHGPWSLRLCAQCAHTHTHTHTHTYKEGTRGVQEYTQVAQNVFVRALIKL